MNFHDIFLLILGIIIFLGGGCYLLFSAQRIRDYTIRKGHYFQFIWLISVITLFLVGFCFLSNLLGLSPQWKGNMSIAGFQVSFNNNNQLPNKPLWYSLQTPFLYAIILSTVGMFLLSGLLVSTFTNIINRRLNLIEKGWIIYRYWGHYIFMGYDDTVIGLIKQLAEQNATQYPANFFKRFIQKFFGQNFYVIVTQKSASDVWLELGTRLDPSLCHKILVVNGQIYSSTMLRELNINFAKKIFIIGDSLNNEYSDSANLCCYNDIKKFLLKNNVKSKDRLFNYLYRKFAKNSPDYSECPEIHLMFKHQSTFAIYQQLELKTQNQDKAPKEASSFDFIPFNFHEMWAQRIFVENFEGKEQNCKTAKFPPRIQYKPLDYEIIPENSEKFVHLVIVGLTPMGIAMAIQAARLGHYANFKKKKTRITFIDANMDVQRNIFASRYDEFYQGVDIVKTKEDSPNETFIEKEGTCSKFTDIELEFMNGRVESPKIRHLLEAWGKDPNRLMTLAICFASPTNSMTAAFCFPQELYQREHFTDPDQSFNRVIPILVNQRIPFNAITGVDSNNKYKNIYPFGMIEDCYNLDLNNFIMPMLVHHLYEAPSQDQKQKWDEFFSQSISVDELKKRWRPLSWADKWSNRYFTDHIPTKYRILGIDINNRNDSEIKITDKLDILAHIEHNRWVIERLLFGFSPAPQDIKEKLRNAKRALESYQGYDDTERNRLKAKIKSIKESIKRSYQHDCIDDFDNLLDTDKAYDKIMCQNMGWILKQYRQNKA